jgi:hypothetical protein
MGAKKNQSDSFGSAEFRPLLNRQNKSLFSPSLTPMAYMVPGRIADDSRSSKPTSKKTQRDASDSRLKNSRRSFDFVIQNNSRSAFIFENLKFQKTSRFRVFA